MTAGRRGEIERNAFERSHEFTSFFFFLKEMNYEAYFLSSTVCVCVCVCVCAYKRQGRLSFFLGLCLFFFREKKKNDGDPLPCR